MDFDLDAFLPYRLFQAAEHASREFHPLYRSAYNLARTEWRVLFNIGQYGPLSSIDIARKSGLEKPKISRAVFKLEDRNWVHRIHDRTNRRTHDLELTEQGKLAFSSLRNMALDFDKRLKTHLGEDAARTLSEQLRLIEAFSFSSTLSEESQKK
ncbi:MAG: MarR family transcriptional regulator [Henriciella sp.]